jgi:hypothetical protein
MYPSHLYEMDLQLICSLDSEAQGIQEKDYEFDLEFFGEIDSEVCKTYKIFSSFSDCFITGIVQAF